MSAAAPREHNWKTPADAAPMPSETLLNVEVGVVGAALLDRDALPLIRRHLRDGEILIDEGVREIYRAILSMADEGLNYDSVSVALYFQDKGREIPAVLLGELSGKGRMPRDAEDAAQKLCKQALCREIVANCSMASRAALAGNLDEAQTIRRKLEAIEMPSKGIEPDDLSRWRTMAEADAEYVIEGIIRRGIVAGVIAQGAGFKTAFSLSLAVAVAGGFSLWPGWRPASAGRVLFLAGEDPRESIADRLAAMEGAFHLPPEQLDAAVSNIDFIAGRPFPLIRGERGGAIVVTEEFDEVLRRCKRIGYALIVIDPLAKFYAADQNDNGAASVFLAALQRLATACGGTVLYTHHVTKASNGALVVTSARGAGAFGDESKWVLNLAPMDDDAGSRYGLDPETHIIAQVTKSNYTRRPRFFFRVFEGNRAGALIEVNPEADRLELIGEAVANFIAENNLALTEREIRREPAGLDLRQHVAKIYNGATADKILKSLPLAVSKGWVELRERTRDGNNKTVKEYAKPCPF